IIVTSGTNIMPLPKELDDLLLAGREIVRRSYLHIDPAQGRSSDDALHRARVGHDDDVVLVGALRAQSLGREHSCDEEGNTFNAQDLSDGIVRTENLARGGAPDDTDL